MHRTHTRTGTAAWVAVVALVFTLSGIAEASWCDLLDQPVTLTSTAAPMADLIKQVVAQMVGSVFFAVAILVGVPIGVAVIGLTVIYALSMTARKAVPPKRTLSPARKMRRSMSRAA